MAGAARGILLGELFGEVPGRAEIGREVVKDCSAVCPYNGVFEGQARLFRITYHEKGEGGKVLREWPEIHCGFWKEKCPGYDSVNAVQRRADAPGTGTAKQV